MERRVKSTKVNPMQRPHRIVEEHLDRVVLHFLRYDTSSFIGWTFYLSTTLLTGVQINLDWSHELEHTIARDIILDVLDDIGVFRFLVHELRKRERRIVLTLHSKMLHEL